MSVALEGFGMLWGFGSLMGLRFGVRELEFLMFLSFRSMVAAIVKDQQSDATDGGGITGVFSCTVGVHIKRCFIFWHLALEL